MIMQAIYNTEKEVDIDKARQDAQNRWLEVKKLLVGILRANKLIVGQFN